tara:strand:- start:18728 stop:19534 length:807 start_codon:yes stop_codon:yes gene_type:complete
MKEEKIQNTPEEAGRWLEERYIFSDGTEVLCPKKAAKMAYERSTSCVCKIYEITKDEDEIFIKEEEAFNFVKDSKARNLVIGLDVEERREEDDPDVFIGPELCVASVMSSGPYCYFKSLKELERGLKKMQPQYDDFEIDFISGPTLQKDLFYAMQVDLGNINDYYESLEEERDEDIIRFIAASRLSQYSNLKTVSDVHSYPDLILHECTLEELTEDWWYNEVVPSIPEHLQWIGDVVDPADAARNRGWHMNKNEMEIDDRTFVVEDYS